MANLKRYPFMGITHEMLVEADRITKNLDTAINEYLELCDKLLWSKLYPLSSEVRTFYKKYEMHFRTRLFSRTLKDIADGVMSSEPFGKGELVANRKRRFGVYLKEKNGDNS